MNLKFGLQVEARIKEVENTSRRRVPMEHVQRAQQAFQAQLATAQRALAEEQARSAELRTKLDAEKVALAARVAELEAKSKQVVTEFNSHVWHRFLLQCRHAVAELEVTAKQVAAQFDSRIWHLFLLQCRHAVAEFNSDVLRHCAIVQTCEKHGREFEWLFLPIGCFESFFHPSGKAVGSRGCHWIQW